MFKIYTSVLILLFYLPYGHAQQTINELHLKTIHEFVDGYNTQDFELMRHSMSKVLKLFFTENRVRELYGTQHQMLGNAAIDKITTKSAQSYYIDLKYDFDTTEVQRLGLSISKKNKIIGLSSSNPKFQFEKTNTTNLASETQILKTIDSLVNLKEKVARFNGCVMVVRNKKEWYKKCAGYTDMEEKTPLNEHSKFDLASCSKQFTAMAIMILQEQGKLLYSDKVNEFFPTFPYKNITVENLLTHTSGLPDYMELLEEKWDLTKIATNQDVLDYLIQYKPKSSFKPGKEYEYSNTGYVLLSLIIEKVSGLSFADYLSQHIFKPLGMKNSRVYNTKYTKDEFLINYSKGHAYSAEYKKHVLVNTVEALDYYRYLDGINGDGAVLSTLVDMTLWDNALREYRLVKQETFDKAIKPFTTSKGDVSNYGFGWELQKDDKFEKVIYHSGNWGGNIMFVLHFLDKELSVFVFSNNEYFNAPKFAHKIAAKVNRL
ncbi:MAG: serine hydrolase domain-containing protein [Saprospiraceae bacterium]